MNRRSFLRALLAATPALVLDPEKLLWVPGQKKIFDLGANLGVDFGIEKYIVQIVVKEGLVALNNSLRLLKDVNREYDYLAEWAPSAGLKVGDTITIRKPERFKVR